MSGKPDFADLQSAYEDVILGFKGMCPEMGIASGRLINEQLKTDKYDPDKVYIVSKKGIEEFHAPD